ncbi:hypothetical protein BDD12DRAFT_46473 [Trichophaea hybrida]|nr:hypothetical protein BDD12DRAFT_46473 [Trichophaea hybrida]
MCDICQRVHPVSLQFFVSHSPHISLSGRAIETPPSLLRESPPSTLQWKPPASSPSPSGCMIPTSSPE